MQKLSIYIPTEPVLGAYYVRTALTELCAITGGASSQDIQGAWLNQFHVVVQEPITVVYALAQEKDAPQCRVYLQKLAREVKEGLKQEAVLVTVEDMKESILVS